MVYVLALLAGLTNALSAIFQRIGVQDAPSGSVMSMRLIRFALSNVVWFLGVALIGVGFLLQAIALDFGQLSSVQPLVPAELLFLVIILGTWFRYPLGWREWGGTAAAAGGLALFLIATAPQNGSLVPTPRHWLTAIVVVAAAAAFFASLGFVGPRWFRAAAFGASGAVLFALSAALTKQLTDLINTGWGHVFTNWDPYALVATGAVGLFLIQSSFNAGPVIASQAALTIVDPLVSVALGIALFGDRLTLSGWHLPAEVLSTVVVVVGVLVLSTSPLVAGATDESAGSDALVRQPKRS